MNIFKREKGQLNPIRRKINYVVVPIYLATVIASIIIGGCLMTVDEKRYAVVFIVLVGFALLLTAALLISIPFVRKKEAVIEAAKYDFDFQSVEKKQSYTFEQRVPVATANIQPSPFDDLTNKTVIVKGAAKLEELLQSFNASVTSDEFSNEENIYVADLTEDCKFTNYEVEKMDNGKINIYEKSRLSFIGDCAYVNDEKFSYGSINATVNSVSVLNQVKLSVVFRFGEYLCANAKLDKNFIAIIKQFNIKVENDGALNLLLTNKINAFKQVLKYGKIKKY